MAVKIISKTIRKTKFNEEMFNFPDVWSVDNSWPWMNKRMETIKTMKYPRRKQEDRVEFFFFCFLWSDHRRWIRLWPCHALSKHTFSLACFPFLLLITLQKSVCYFEKHFVDVKQHFFSNKNKLFFQQTR